jgi:hypothetical protein
MQTFLPYPSFVDSAKTLDDKRLGKQIIECQQILKACTNPDYGWQNHPAVNMWRGYEGALLTYQGHCALEWKLRRGNEHGAWTNTLDYLGGLDVTLATNKPPWLGNKAFHASHRSNLLRKDVEWYGQFGWDEDDSREYVWPGKDLLHA